MLLRYHTEKLQEILKEFHNLTGMSVSVVDTDFHHLVYYPDPLNPFCTLIQSCKEGDTRCFLSDTTLLQCCQKAGHPVSHVCHAGLTDTAVPLYHDDTLLGYIMFGQVCQHSAQPLSYDEIAPRIQDLPLDSSMLLDAYQHLQFFEAAKIQSAARILSMLTDYLWLEHMIQPEYDEDLEPLLTYIENNLQEPLSVENLCTRFHISKSALYRKFQKYLHTTINGYVTQLRMQKAQDLLETTDLPIYRICEETGIDNYQYFCRRFKQQNGVTPLQYRKEYR